jgi:hypothetical protein
MGIMCLRPGTCQMVTLGNNPIRYKKAMIMGTTDSLSEVMSIDNENKECEWSLAVRHFNTSEIDTIDESLKDLGLSLNDPDVWIRDTRAMTHNTAYLKNAVNHRVPAAQDNVVGVTGPLAKAN